MDSYKLERDKRFQGKGNNMGEAKTSSRPVILMIMDGIGIGRRDKGDGVFLANPQFLNSAIEKAKSENLYCELKAHGTFVGMVSDEDVGNSEVGHNAMGSGQVFSQGAKRVSEAIKSEEIFSTTGWKEVVEKCSSKSGKVLHFMGLLSDGNVHSNISQLFKLLEGAVRDHIKKIRLHILLDGRDVAPDSSLHYVELLENKLNELRKQTPDLDIFIASGGGRMSVTMDRYNSDWNIVRRGWWAHVIGVVNEPEATPAYSGYFKSTKEAILAARSLYPDKLDQYNPPFVIVDEKGRALGRMERGDAIINFNFRGDRAIQISEAFLKDSKDFPHFDRGDYPGFPGVPDVTYLGLLEYDSEIHLPPKYLVPPPSINHVLGNYLSAEKIKSYAIAETHKYGHVTYFWNGNKSGYLSPEFEKYEEIRSLPNETIEATPKMKIAEVTDRLIEAIQSKKYNFLRVNFANGDMVGHTGNLESTIKAVQDVDNSLRRVVDEAKKVGAICVITADHGNAEEMLDNKGKRMTGHTLNKVPFIIIDPSDEELHYKMKEGMDKEKLGISAVAATLLNLLGFKEPDFYTPSLISPK